VKLIRACLFLALSAVVSWHFLLRPSDLSPAQTPKIARVEIAVAPGVVPEETVPEKTAPEKTVPEDTIPEAAEPETDAQEPAAEPAPVPPIPQPDETPPAPERGDPDGDEDVEETEPVPEVSKEEQTRGEIASIRGSAKKVKRAADELSGKTRRGFRTVLYSSAEDQLAIARTFGEQLVLVPRKGLDPKRPHYYLLDASGAGTVRRVAAKAPLEQFRQYRDFFAFEYSDLPDAVRGLRRKVTVRSDVFLFAALIPPSEWAVVMSRRAAALQDSGRKIEDLRRAEMRYVALPGGGYDIRVKQLLFADGSRWTQTS
jgi:hypothetical protein